MGTEKSRAIKIEWMTMMKSKVKDRQVLLNTFMVRFSCTRQNAKEILDLVLRDVGYSKKHLDQRKLK